MDLYLLAVIGLIVLTSGAVLFIRHAGPENAGAPPTDELSADDFTIIEG